MDEMNILIVGGIAFLIFMIYLKLTQAKRKGVRGESCVARKLRRLPKEHYHVLNDLLLKTPRSSSQVDHLVVSNFGLYVIETKNYRGWIHGSDKSQYWKQTIYRYKNKFLNPVKQNWTHVNALKRILEGIDGIQYFPIVVFAGSATLKNVYSKVPVIYDNQVRRYILNNQSRNVLSDHQIKLILDRLTDATLHGRQSRKEHVRNIKQTQMQKKKTSRSKLKSKNKNDCPRCGSSLILRDGKYGKFYGCSRYPKCQFTRNV